MGRAMYSFMWIGIVLLTVSLYALMVRFTGS
jgi:ABC-type uncharacterized transport system permease subunit